MAAEAENSTRPSRTRACLLKGSGAWKAGGGVRLKFDGGLATTGLGQYETLSEAQIPKNRSCFATLAFLRRPNI